LLTAKAPDQGEFEMKNIVTRTAELLVLALVFAAGVTLAGCQEGPLEEAGEEVDEAIDDAGDALD